ncbi:hypothetical protein B0A63_06780 [Flavobacterium johnsoniae UW101]|jgi:hypothetical protein|uniref:O-antigen polysaccharide polymerase Wzy n=2 Tax=Flavobacterium johnsoniae TaxID=986 RepID=A5FN37_FLAJ1|nr:hypothetical protein Fjoh_0342 [Flavobacterium johnsoniae UW101]OXG01206.1 hypothetical protein B0A63_06780 [Flavobacterium johnsoniae UW101]
MFKEGNLFYIKKSFLLKSIFALINIGLMLLSNFFALGKTLLIMAILTNVFIIWEMRRIQPAVLMGVFFLSYLLYLIPYYYGDYIISAHTQYYRRDLYDQMLGIHLLFLSSFLLFLKSNLNKSSLKIRDLIKPNNNIILFSFLYLIMLGIILSIKGNSVIGGSYSTYIDNLEGQGGSVEYFYIFFVIAFFFTDKPFLRKSLLLLVVYYCFMTITRGYRIQFVQMVIVVFVLFFDGKFKTVYMMIFAFLGFIIAEIVNLLKMMGSLTVEDTLALFEKSDKGIIISNQTDVFYSSVVFLGLIKDDIFSLGLRIWSTIGFIWNWFVPSSFVWIEARVPMFAGTFTSLGGGGLVSAYFYVWFGYLGPILIGFCLAFLFNKTYSSADKKVFKIIAILVLSLYPRWFAYDPANFLIRLSLYIYVVYIGFILIHNQMKGVKK